MQQRSAYLLHCNHCPTWQSFCPFDHFDKLSLSQFIEAGEQGVSGVRLATVVARIHNLRLNGLQDVEEDQVGVQLHTSFRRDVRDNLHWILSTMIFFWAFLLSNLLQLTCCKQK